MKHTKETPLQRLERLRAEVAAHEAKAASAPLPIRPGDTFHALVATGIHTGGQFLGSTHQTRPGENIIATQAMIEASRNTAGWSWFSIIGDDEAQRRLWGEVRFRPGPAPADAPTWSRRGDPDWTRARDAAVAEAWAMPTAEARAEALAEIQKRFGPPASTASYWIMEDPSVKLAEEQRAALDAGGVRLKSHYSAQEPGVRR